MATVGGLTVAIVAAALGMFFATSGTYEVAATVVDDATLPQIEIKGVRLHAETYGDPSNPVIIVLHGGPGGDYRSQLGARSLADKNFVVFYDQRGAGLSERVPAEELTVATYMAELDGVIEKYSPDRPVTLLGHSWGAMLATAYLRQAPEKVARAILLEPGFLLAKVCKIGSKQQIHICLDWDFISRSLSVLSNRCMCLVPTRVPAKTIR